MDTDSTMTNLDWNESFSVNIKKFDRQHSLLFEYVSKLGNLAMSKDENDRKIIGQTLSKMVAYITSHFIDEEVEMYHHQYPDFDKHKEAHDRFLSKARNFIVFFQVDKGSILLNCEIVAFLTEWFTDHLKDMDMDCARYLNSKGVY